MRRKLRGLSLLEATVVVALVGLVLLLLADLLTGAKQASRILQARDQTTVALVETLDWVRQDVSEAYEITTPAPASVASSTTLQFKRINNACDADPANPRLPAAFLPNPVWHPHSTGQSLDIDYHMQGAQFTRTTVGASTLEEHLSSSLSGFSVQWKGPSAIELRVTVDLNAGHTRSLSTIAWLRLPPQVFP